MVATPQLESREGSTTPELPRRVLAAWAVVAVLLVVARLAAPYIGALAGTPLVGGVFHRVVEIWLVAGITLWALPPRFVLRLLRGLHPARLMLLLAVAAMVLVGQFGYRSLDLYPFVEWGMYSSLTDRLVYSEYLLVRDGQVGEQLSINELVPTSMRGFMGRVDDHIEAAAEGDPDARALVAETFTSLVARLDEPEVDAVLVRRCVVEEPSIEQPVTCEPVISVPVTSATS